MPKEAVRLDAELSKIDFFLGRYIDTNFVRCSLPRAEYENYPASYQHLFTYGVASLLWAA